MLGNRRVRVLTGPLTSLSFCIMNGIVVYRVDGAKGKEKRPIARSQPSKREQGE